MPPAPTPLSDIALVFLKLGTTAFGGPAAHVAMMEEEVVRRRAWLTHEAFLELLGAAQLIPGPNSTELAIHVGYARGGWRGLVVAGVAFILPAALIVTALGWAYVRFGALPETAGLLYGVKPVVVAVVAQALWGLGRSALRGWVPAVIAAGSAGLALAGVGELWLLFGAGLASAIAAVAVRAARGRTRPPVNLAVLAGLSASVGPAAGAVSAPFSLGSLFLFFAKVGSVLYGSGYVLLAFLRTDLVVRRAWLTDAQLLDAIAVGQVTPGPVFTTATFVGYLLARGSGAAVATLGIFLPAFAFVAISGPLLPLLRRSPTAKAFLDGVIAASLALMAVVTWHLARAALVDVPALLLAAASALLLVRYRVNSSWLVLAGALIGVALAANWGTR